ncbi:MAG TPA: EamA family transporter [Alphaproteobacteria bacterium]
MKLDLLVVGLVLLSALIHASWNAIVKSDRDQLVSFALVMFAGTVMGLIAVPFLSLPGAAAWPFLIASTLIHNAYYFFLLRAYAHGDLSHVYPIARGLGPLLVALLSGTLIGEHLTAGEAAGVSLVSVGIIALALSKGLPRASEWRPTLYAVATGATIAGYTIVDGLGARASNDALSYIAWLNVLEGPWVMLVAIMQRGRAIAPYLRKHAWRGVAGGVIATVGYGIAIWALSLGAMAHVAALRETSVLFGALIGTVLLREAFGFRRVIAAALIVGGLLLMHIPF